MRKKTRNRNKDLSVSVSLNKAVFARISLDDPWILSSDIWVGSVPLRAERCLSLVLPVSQVSALLAPSFRPYSSCRGPFSGETSLQARISGA